MSTKRGPVFTCGLPGWRLAPLPPISYATGCRIHSTLRPSNHNCKNIRLHVKTNEWNTLSPTI